MLPIVLDLGTNIYTLAHGHLSQLLDRPLGLNLHTATPVMPVDSTERLKIKPHIVLHEHICLSHRSHCLVNS